MQLIKKINIDNITSAEFVVNTCDCSGSWRLKILKDNDLFLIKVSAGTVLALLESKRNFEANMSGWSGSGDE